ncbi:hypothetical protein K505DRAFT_322301 [Melanomma pulvis-pyrius CBS 109.77]|uniref:Uncharacterized protein n=1 Tax=Melanomma pulvis-pyrius CBS 109.77 TaxID=1314802 RepID=A0A6A6XNG0_9PLEO|nr:hypothetical protein K505DRAFT_322301 [Melanomma pulvis-pyrius CBS 109.77]
MASMRKSYILVPSWALDPAEVILGSVIANVKAPHKTLSATALPTHIDTPIPPPIVDKSCSGIAKRTRESNAGLFSTFINVITFGGEVSFASSLSFEVEYSCDTMETRRFSPSLSYITKATEDAGVKQHLKMGGLGAKAFMITGIKTTSNVVIGTTEEKGRETTAQVGVHIPAAQMTVGPKGSHKSSQYNKNTRTIEGPIVFAFQVEKIRVNRKGKASSEEHIDGAMLSRGGSSAGEYIIERAGQILDDDDLDDFEVEVWSGIDEETGDVCDIVVP